MRNGTGDGIDNPFLNRLRRLTALGGDGLDAVEGACGVARRVNARCDIVREGTAPERLHMVLDGWACRFKLLSDGRRQISAVLLPGDLCDLDTLYVPRASYSVATLTACSIATLDRAALRDLSMRDPAVAEAFGALLALDNAMLVERSACLGRRSAREQIAHFLCELFVRLTVVDHAHDDGFVLPITQEEIGDVLGLTAVHVNRVLQGLRHDHVIEQTAHRIVIPEWSVLRRIGEFRPDYLHSGRIDGAASNPQVPGALLSAGGKTGAGAPR